MSTPDPSLPRIAIHAHCYQPPREDPFTGRVPAEPTALPFHDWNARITAECYAPLVHARDLTGHVYVNLFEWMSFDLAPTLATWLERHAPHVLQAMIAGDAAAIARTGHGNAIATTWHHVILPLASPRERAQEIAWGLADFRARFGRDPLGFWCPETAMDDDTAAALCDAGLRFALVAPNQIAGGAWSTQPVTWRQGDRSLVLVPYDGQTSGAIGFTNLVQDGAALAAALLRGATTHGVTSVATDGETFGHHKRHGEMGLAAAVGILHRSRQAAVVGTEALVAVHDEWPEAQLVSPSAWSCAHGVQRWRANCGCRADHTRPARQQWRGPLREALRWLADAIDEGDGERDDAAMPAWDARTARYAMFTSCGWFFDEFEGHETRILLRFAARAMAGRADAAQLEAGFVERLAHAECNDRALGTGADLWRRDFASLVRSEALVAR
ncbi:MAG: DUF3536 domain-containing protein [Gemmatimonadaceae bacterium]|jgi:hypothetical protein|nr:DUF3536 domain-containing protein [Gemmatimonadaceae bacterium]